jgi:hypothetical protein
MSRLFPTMLRRLVLAFMSVMLLTGISAIPAQADQPQAFSFTEVFDGVNPCTGEPQEVTINRSGTVHTHKNNLVLNIKNTGTTSDGFVMEHGIQHITVKGSAVDGLARISTSDQWRHPDGRKFHVTGTDLIRFPGTVLSQRFNARCLGA